MHILKGGASDYGSLKKEALREDNFKSKVGTIDPNLTFMNYGLVADAPEDIDGFIKGLGVERKIRSDAVRFVSIIVDYPKDETRYSKDFFEDAKKEIQDYFDVKNEAVLYAQVHLDEGHPHMHFAFVPTVEQEKIYKDGHSEMKVKLSAKDMLTRERLQQFHPHMQERMHELGYTGTIHHNDGIKRDKDFMEHKLDMIEQETKRATKELERAKDDTEFWKKQAETLTDKTFEMRDKVSKLTDEKTRLTEEVASTKKELKQEADRFNRVANASLKLMDPEREEPVIIPFNGGQLPLEPIPKLERQNKELQGSIAQQQLLNNDLVTVYNNLGEDISGRRASIEKLDMELEAKQDRYESMKELSDTFVEKELVVEPYSVREGFLGKREGVFIEGASVEDIKAIYDRADYTDLFSKQAKAMQDRAKDRADSMVERAREQATKMVSDAQGQIDQANAILKQRDQILRQAQETQRQAQMMLEQAQRDSNSIIDKAKKQAKEILDKIKTEYETLKERVSELLGTRQSLQKEVEELIHTKDVLEPLRAEYEQLKEGVEVLEGKYKYEYTKSSFVEDKDLPWGSTMKYRDSGELIALYQDGHTRQVGSNENGGLDNQTLRDQADGRCVIGIMREEEHVTMPKRLVNELLQNRDRSKGMSESLENFLEQQNKVNEVVRHRGRGR